MTHFELPLGLRAADSDFKAWGGGKVEQVLLFIAHVK